MTDIKYAHTAVLDGHSKGITNVAFNNNSSLLATAGLDGTVCLWNTSTWKISDIYFSKSAVTGLAWFSDTALVCGLEDGVLSSLVKDGETLTVSGFWAHVYPIEHLSVSGNLLASGAHSELSVWHWAPDAAGACLAKALGAPPNGKSVTEDTMGSSDDAEVLVTGVFWASSILIVTYLNQGIRFVDSQSWDTVRMIDTEYSIVRGSLSPNGAFLAASTLASGFVVYDLEQGKIIRTFKHAQGEEQRAIPVLFIHGGYAVAGGSAVGTVNVWLVDSGCKLASLRIPNKEKVFAIAGYYNSTSDQFVVATGAMNENGPSTVSIWIATPHAEAEHSDAVRTEEAVDVADGRAAKPLGMYREVGYILIAILVIIAFGCAVLDGEMSEDTWGDF
ncbi:WD40-repeat-containing domain protein [Daedaleopsis nitida]|nr:WD40-repeat-containing domain protein [Daedaleopsis nitida]